MTRLEDDGDALDLSDLMQLAAENVSNARWTMLPVRVILYDPIKQCVDVQPVVAVGTAMAFLGERPGLIVLVPAAVLFAGIWLVVRSGDRTR